MSKNSTISIIVIVHKVERIIMIQQLVKVSIMHLIKIFPWFTIIYLRLFRQIFPLRQTRIKITIKKIILIIVKNPIIFLIIADN